MKTFKQYVNEALDKPYDYDEMGSMKNSSGEREHWYGFKDHKGVPTHVYISHSKDKDGNVKASVDFTDEHAGGHSDDINAYSNRHYIPVNRNKE